MGAEIIIVPAAFLLTGYVVFTIVDGILRWRRLRVSTEFQGKLLERIGFTREFGEFLNTEGGGRFIDVIGTERGGSAHARILRAVQTGIVLVVLGAALFMFIRWVTLPYPVPENLGFLATVATAIGVGLLLSSVVWSILLEKDGTNRRSGAPCASRDHRVVRCLSSRSLPSASSTAVMRGHCGGPCIG